MNKKQKEALQNAVSKCRYPVNEVEKYISVPLDEEEKASFDMFVSYLRREFDFKIQLAIPGSVEVKPEFNPVFKARVTHDTQPGLYKSGQRFFISHSATTIISENLGNGKYSFKYSDGTNYTEELDEYMINRRVQRKEWVKLKY